MCAGPKLAQPQDLNSVSVSFSTHMNIFPGGSVVKNPPAKQETQKGRFLGEGNGNPLQYSRLENPMDRGAGSATVHVVAKSQVQLSD